MSRTDQFSIPLIVWIQAAAIFLIGLWACWPAFAHLGLVLDNQHYFFISERAASGVPPHISQFDPKNALSMLMAGAAIFMGRGLGIDEVVASRIVSVLCGIGSWSLIFLLARHFTGSSATGWIAAASMASLDRYLHMVAMGSRPKVFVVFFSVAAVWLIARNRPKSAGATASAAFLCWQPALLMVGVGAVSLAVARRWRDAVSFLAAALLLFLMYEAYFVWHGVLDEQIEQAYRFPSEFMGSFPHRWAPLVMHFKWVVAVSKQVSWRSVLPLAFVGTALLGWVVTVLRPVRVWKFLTEDPSRMYFVLAAHATFAFTLTNYQGFPDRFFVEPFMATAVSIPVYLVLSRIPVSIHRQAMAVVTALSLVALLGFGQKARARYQRSAGLEQQRVAAEQIAHYLDEGLSVYAVGCTHLLAMSRVNNFTKFGFFFRGVPEYLAAVTGKTNYLPLRNRALPDLVLISRPKYIRSRPWLKSEYEPLRRPEFIRVGIRAYVRKPNAKRFILDSRASAGVR